MGYSGVFENTFFPFGHGTLTAGGTQYGDETTLTVGSTYTEIDSFTMNLPTNFQMVELECYLQGAVASSAAGTVLVKWQGSDDGSNWADLSSAQTSTAASSTSYVDTPAVSGICSTSASTNFTMRSNPLYIRMVAAPGSTTAASENAKAKGTSYVIARYWIA